MKSIQNLAIAAALVTAANAATLANYDIGDGALGGSLFFDLATTGGNDEAGEGYVMKYTGLWIAGDQVSLTGIAIPIWTDNTTGTSNNTPTGGTFTISFYDLGADGIFSGSASETLLGTNTVDFNGGTPAIDAYAALFDTPTNFTALSTGLAIHLDYSGGSIRLKSAGGIATGDRLNLSNGTAQGGRDVLLSLSGTAVPEPSTALLGALGALCLLRRRR
jgi:hypothetical protein